MKKLTRILLVVLTLTIVATSVAGCEFTDKLTSWIDKVYDYIVTGCVHEGGAATCTEKAICSLCGQPYGKPLGHTPEAIPGIDPTCTESGITEGSRCAVCGEILESQKPLSPLGHSFGEWEVTTAATCTTDGERKSTCSTCGETHTEVIKANGHTEVVDTGKPATCTEDGLTDGKHCSVCNTVIVAQQTIQKTQHEYEKKVTAPKCTEQGYTTYTCKNCDDSYTSDYKKPTGHSFGDWETTTPATCTAEGVQTRKCSCGATETMPIAKKAHSYTDVVTAPTCTAMGYTTHTCSCGESYKSDYKSATGHSFGDWEITTPATCTAEGVQTRTCTHKDCTANETMPVGAKGHNYVKNNGLSKTATCTEGGYDYFKCTRCDAHYTTNNTPANGHTFTGTNTKCDNCDVVRGCQHPNTEVLAAKPATCTTTGLTAGLKCKDCGDILTAQTTILALGHDFESTGGTVVTNPTCTDAGYTTYTCQRTGCTHSYKSDYTSATGHDWGEWSTTTPATCTTDGEQTRTCGNCSATDTKVIGATGHDCEKNTALSKAPTCTEIGYDYYKCKNCDHNYKDNYQPALGHNVTWAQTKAPTCTETGTITGVCTRDGCTGSTGLTATVAALGHTGGTATCKTQATCTVCGNKYGDLDSSNHEGTVNTTTWYHDASKHWNQYTCCGAHANETAHSVGESGTAAGCETQAVCGTCGQKFGEPNGHTPKDGWIDDGEGKHYKECENCDKHLNETAHTYAETWNKDGTNHWHECECGAKNDIAAHTYTNGLCLCGALQPKTLRIETKADLLAFRDSVNGGNLYAGWTVYLINDIDLENADFGGIGTDHIKGYGSTVYNPADNNAYFLGTFDGLGHTVKNFKITSDNDEGFATAGFFNSLATGAHIKDLTVEGATINSTHYAGGIVGYWAMTGVTVEGCHVKTSTITSAPQQIGEEWDNGDKVGGIVGFASNNGSIKDCTVTDTTIKGYRNLGGIAGYLSAVTAENCSISGVTIDVDSSHDYKGYGIDQSKYNANSIVGVNGYATTNCTGTATINYGTLTCVHDWKDATCTTPKTCKLCTVTEGNALGHDMADATCTAPSTCKREGCTHTEGTALGHTGGTATCTAKATCTRCSQPYGELGEHNYGTLIPEQPANCTETGVAAHYECSVCGKLFDSSKVEKTLAQLTLATNSTHKGTLGEWQYNADGHWKTYSCHSDVKANEGTHTYGTDGKCECGYTKPVAHTHTFTAVSGVTGLFHCDGCGKDFKSNTSWELLTDASKLKAGVQIIITTSGDNNFALGAQSATYRAKVDINKSDIANSISDGMVITIKDGASTGTFALYDDTNKYIYADGDKKIKNKEALDSTGSWYITIDSNGIATIRCADSDYSNYCLKYNAGSPRFTIYTSDQTSLSIYIKNIEYDEVAEHVCADNVTGTTCTADGTCSVCGRTVENSKTPHVYVDHFCTCGAEQPKMYLATSANWREAGAWFAASFWNSTGGAWERMTDDDLDGVYECYIPDGMTQVIILRKNPENQNLDWGGEWARVSDQTLPTNGNNCYKVINWNDEGSGWTTFNGGIWVLGTINATEPWNTNDDRLMTFDSTTNLWTLVYNNVATGTYEIKLKDSIDNWYGTAEGNNVSVTVPSNHSKVTVTFSVSGGVSVSVDAHVHDWTWTTTSTTHKQTCLCGDVQNEGSHSYTNGLCVCGAIDPDYYFPKNISDLNDLDDGTKVEFTGTVVEINTNWNSSKNYISVTVSDGNGNTFYIYRLATNVALCDVITVQGEIGTYNSSKQIAAGATATIGATKGHDWANATCALPKTCKICSATDGDALGHDYVDGVCSRCDDVQGKQTTVTVTISEYATNKGWTKNSKYTSVILDSNITATASGGGDTGTYNTQWRMYQSSGSTLTISAAGGKTIVSVKITYEKSNSGTLTYNGSNIGSGTLVDVNANSITFSVGNTSTKSNGQARITSIEVVYK